MGGCVVSETETTPDEDRATFVLIPALGGRSLVAMFSDGSWGHWVPRIAAPLRLDEAI